MAIDHATKFDYTYMQTITVKRQDEKEYKFGEADFPDLHLNDIEDM